MHTLCFEQHQEPKLALCSRESEETVDNHLCAFRVCPIPLGQTQGKTKCFDEDYKILTNVFLHSMIKVLEIMPLASSAINFIGDQLSYLRDKGNYDMHLICSSGKDIDQFAEREKAHYYTIEIPRSIKPIKDISNIWKIYRYIRKNQINVVIGHQSKGVLYGMIAGWMAHARYRIVLAHGILEDTMHGLKQKIFVAENRMMSSLATHVICVSPSVKKRRVELGIDTPEKQHILGRGTCNGVNALTKFNPMLVDRSVTQDIRHKFGLLDSDFVVGFCGRLVKDKGIVELTNAIQILHERYPDKSVKLFVIGQPEQRNAIPQEILQFLKTSDQVVFTGRVSYSDIQNYYSVMDVFVLPSYREGFPTVVLEASAMELPVIVSRSTGCIDSIIENETGIYCDIEPTSIADAIESLFDISMAKKLGANARRNVLENFEHTIVKEQMLHFLNSVSEN